MFGILSSSWHSARVREAGPTACGTGVQRQPRVRSRPVHPESVLVHRASLTRGGTGSGSPGKKSGHCVSPPPWTSQYPYSAGPVHPLPVPGLPLRFPEFPGTPGSPRPGVTTLFGRGRIGVKELSPPKKRSVHFTQVGFIANHFPILFNGLDQAVKYSLSILLREKKMPGCLKAQF